MRKPQIYFLRDETGFVKYVGTTINALEARLCSHIHDAKHGNMSKKSKEIRKMLKREIKPTIDLITELEHEYNARRAEKAYIKWLRSKGIDLWNGDDGGGGRI